MTPNHSQQTVDQPLLDRLEHALIAGRIDRRGFIRAAAAAGLAGSGLQVLADELDGIRATGVEIGGKSGPLRIQAKLEVILCSGGINTPKLLMLSGIGDEAQLRTHGIKTRVNAPQVGQNFQDHILHGGCLWEPTAPSCRASRRWPPWPAAC